jgi:hypothetical protein
VPTTDVARRRVSALVAAIVAGSCQSANRPRHGQDDSVFALTYNGASRCSRRRSDAASPSGPKHPHGGSADGLRARGAFTKNECEVDASSSAGVNPGRFGPQTPGQTHSTLAARGLSSRAPTLGRIAPETTRPATHPHLTKLPRAPGSSRAHRSLN